MRWQTVPLDELQSDTPRSITDGPFGSNLARRHYTDSGPQVVRLQNIGDGVYIDSPAHISQEHYETLQAHAVLPGDLLLASLGEILPRACLAPAHLGPAIVKADCIRVRLSDRVDPRWVMYSMQRPEVRRWADDQRHGVGRPRLGLGVIRRIPVPLPDLVKQRRIVDLLEEYLSSLDAARSAIADSQRRLEVLRLADLQRVRRRSEDLGPSTSLSHIASTSLGKMLDAKRQTGIPTRYLRNINVRWGHFDLDNLESTLLTPEDVNRLTLIPGDIVACEGGEPGRCAIWREENSGIAFQKALHRIRVNDPLDVHPEFVALMLEEGIRTGRWDGRLTGTTIRHLPQQQLRQLEIPVPPVAAQASLSAEATDLNARRLRLAGQIATTHTRSEALRRALLDAAFSGRLTGRSSDSELVEELADQEAS